MAKADPDMLLASERRDFQKAITNRRELMLQALEDQLGVSIDDILSEMRIADGIDMDEDQIGELISEFDTQIKSEIGKYIGGERRRIEVAIEEINDSFDARERDLKARHKQEFDNLRTERQKSQETLRNELRNAEERVANEHVKPLMDKKSEYEKKLVFTKETNKKIVFVAEQRVKMIDGQRGKLRNLINDAASRSLEELITTNSRAKATELLHRVPTVADAIEMIRSERGLLTLISNLDPRQKALPNLSTGNNIAIETIDVEVGAVSDVEVEDAACSS